MILATTMRKLQEKDATIYRLDFGPMNLRVMFPGVPIDDKAAIIEGGYELFATMKQAQTAAQARTTMIAIVPTPARHYCQLTGKHL